MPYSIEQKRYIVICMLGILALTLFGLYTQRFDGSKQVVQNAVQKSDQNVYADYLKSVEVDKAASQKVFNDVIKPGDVQKQIEAALNTKQNIIYPEIPDTEIIIAKTKGRQAVVDYLVGLDDQLTHFSEQLSLTGTPSTDFNRHFSLVATAEPAAKQVAENLRGLPVPKDAALLHKSSIVAFDEVAHLLAILPKDDTGDDLSFAKDMYRTSVVLEHSFSTVRGEVARLAKALQISELPTGKNDGSFGIIDTFGGLIKTAHAFIAVPIAPQPVVVIEDIPRTTEHTIRSLISYGFAIFAAVYGNTFLQKINDNYLVANVLYYSDALVATQYGNDYLAKYLPDGIDQAMVRVFIPQMSCGKYDPKVKNISKQRAADYLGFDPAHIPYDDPNYMAKIAASATYFSRPQNWEQYYTDVAQLVEAAAQREVTREYLGPTKAPRDPKTLSTVVSQDYVRKGVQAIFQSLPDTGSGMTEAIASILAKQLVQILLDKYLFKGATITEQKVCLNTPTLNPVIPVGPTTVPIR